MIFYMSAIRRFGRQLWREPHTVMIASLLMTLLGLPIVTAGLALCAGTLYMHHKEAGEQISFRTALGMVRPVAGRAIAMGLIDVAGVVACISCVAWLIAGKGFLQTLPSVVLLYLLLFYLSTALFRYPALALNQQLKLPQLVLCTISLVLGNMGYVFLYWCVVLLALMICAATGVGLVLLLPGCTALMMTTAWSESLKRDEYNKNKGGKPV